MPVFYGELLLNPDLDSCHVLHLNINLADANVVRKKKRATILQDTKKRSLADE